MIWPYVIAFVVSLVVSFALRPKPDSQKPPGFDEVKFPTAEVGREIPVLFGTKHISGANVVWFGDILTTEIKKKKQTVGWRYYASIQMVLCNAAELITEIRFDNKVAWRGRRVNNGDIFIDAPLLFGGEDREGGVGGTYQAPITGRWVPDPNNVSTGSRWEAIEQPVTNVGTMTVAYGSRYQPVDNFLKQKLGDHCPAFRGVTSVVFKNFYFGNSHYIKPPSFKVSRAVSEFGGTFYSGGEDKGMNPAAIIWDCLCNNDWGMGYPLSAIDSDSFNAAQATLKSEDMFMSFLWDKSISIEDFIKQILEHIDGSLYISRQTGKFVLKLIRYNEEEVKNAITLNEDNIVKITNYKRSLESELVSQVTIKYWDNDTNKEALVSVSDDALAMSQGAPISTVKIYHGFTDATVAQRVALRTLKALSQPMASCTIEADRTAAQLAIGDVFWLSWAPYGITKTLMRVASIEYGTVEHVAVRMQCVEDAFSLPQSQFREPGTEWENFYTEPPKDLADRVVIEAPYYEVIQQGLTTYENGGDNYIVSCGARKDFTTTDIVALVKEHSSAPFFPQLDGRGICPYVVIRESIGRRDTVIRFGLQQDMASVKLGTYALLGDEFVIVDVINYTESTVTVRRGALDTTPKAHAAGSRILFCDDSFVGTLYGTRYAVNIQVKLQAIGLAGSYPFDQTPMIDIRTNKRSSRPYNAANVKINGDLDASTIQPNAELVVRWNHRNRLMDTFSGSYQSTSANEAGVSYRCVLSREGKADVEVVTSSTKATFSAAEVGQDFQTATVKVWSKKGDLECWQPWVFELTA